MLLPADRQGEAFLQLFTANNIKTGTGQMINQCETVQCHYKHLTSRFYRWWRSMNEKLWQHDMITSGNMKHVNREWKLLLYFHKIIMSLYYLHVFLASPSVLSLVSAHFSNSGSVDTNRTHNHQPHLPFTPNTTVSALTDHYINHSELQI
jgi:hypothetical protein